MSNKGRVILNTVTTRPSDSVSDAFGRFRTSSPYSLFDSQFSYDKADLYWNEEIAGGGSSATYLPDENSVQFTVGTASGDLVVRQSKKYTPYFPGKSQFVSLTGVLGDPVANQIKRIGYFDDRNGLFFELAEDGLYLVRRTSTSGSPVDTRVPQSQWSLDPLDGSGPSQITLDTTKTLIFVIDLQWLGSGRVRWGFSFGNGPTYVHEFVGANEETSVYMTTANLPVRYEVRNTGTSAGSSDFKQICASSVTESGAIGDFPQQLGTASTDLTTGITVGATEIPLISFRPKQTFNGKPVTSPIVAAEVDLILTGTGSARWVLRYDPTIDDTAWISAGPESLVEYNLDATTTTGGLPIASGFLSSSGAGGSQKGSSLNASLQNKLVASRSIDGTTADHFTLTIEGVGGATPDAFAQVSWIETH